MHGLSGFFFLLSSGFRADCWKESSLKRDHPPSHLFLYPPPISYNYTVGGLACRKDARNSQGKKKKRKKKKKGKNSLLPDMEDLQPVLDFLRKIFDIFAVLSWQQDCLDSCTESTNEFLLDTAYGSDTSA